MISPFERWYRLVPRGGAGLVCDDSGIALGAVDLAPAHRNANGIYRCEVRSEAEVGRVLTLAYGQQADARVARLHRGLRRAAGWIEAGDLCLASLETVMLRLPDLTAEGMAKLAEAADLEKGGTAWQDQPRRPGGESGGGQWTSGDGGSAAEPEQPDEAVHEGRSVALDDGVYRPGVDHPAITPVAAEEAESRGSNGPPPDEVTSLKQVFPGFEPGVTAAILAPVDGVLGFSALADEANLEATMAAYRRLTAEIKEVDPSFVDAELLPEGGIAGLSFEGRNSLIDHLLMTRASAYYRLRGDAGRLQVETLRFLQKSVDGAYTKAIEEYDAGRYNPRLPRDVAVGQHMDGNVRRGLKELFSMYKIPYGPGTEIIVNNRDHNSRPPVSYRVPDLRIRDVTYDWSLTRKTAGSRQIRGFFAADARPRATVIIRPSQRGATYLLPRSSSSRSKR